MASKGVAAAALESSDQASASVAGLQAWTQLSVQMRSRSATLDRDQGRPLFARLQVLTLRMAQEPRTTGAVPGTEPSLQLTVLSNGNALAVLRLWDGVALWQRPDQAAVLFGVSAAETQAWLLLAEQALAASAVPSR